MLIAGFSLILIYFFRKIILLRKIDYSAPVISFLRKAEQRYTFIPRSDWFIIAPILAILGIGGGFIVYYSFIKYFENSPVPLIIYIIFFISLVVFGFWAGKKDWKKGNGRESRLIIVRNAVGSGSTGANSIRLLNVQCLKNSPKGIILPLPSSGDTMIITVITVNITKEGRKAG